MKILVVHNFYQISGGEDSVFDNEVKLLKEHGHEVIEYTVDNAAIKTIWSKLKLIFGTVFSTNQYYKFSQVLKTHSPDVVHVHNYFPLLSPSIFYACKRLNVPVVHTLHNYRAVCPTALLMHQGKINETSIKGSAFWGVSKRVYRNSAIASFVLALMIEMHKRLGTWQNKVDGFIVLTEFGRKKYIEAGWPSHKLWVKPNFLPDPLNSDLSSATKDGYAIFVGRLSEEKGIKDLLSAWRHCEFPLKIVGTGPLQSIVEENTNEAVQYLGGRNHAQVLELIQQANFVVLASTCYEGFPMVLAEALSCGTPAVVPKLGSMAEIIRDGVTGLHFMPGNSDDLADKVRWMSEHSEQLKTMGFNARQEYLDNFTPEKNYQMLTEIYRKAVAGALHHG